MAGLRGAGKVYLSVLSGGSYGGYMDMANIASFTIGNEGSDTQRLKSTAPQNYGAVIGSATTPGDDTISIALNVPNRKNLTAMLLGADTGVTVTGSTGSEDLTPAAKGVILPLTKRKVSAVTVTTKSPGAARENSTVYALDAYMTPATPNTYYYKATTGGTSAGSPPTFGTVIGGTTSDGTVVWTNMGLIVKAANTDYVVDADNGLVEILSTSTSVNPGEVLTIAYTYASYSGYTINARAQSALNCKMLFVGENLDSGELIRLTADAVELSPEGDFSLISADGEFLEFTLSGTIKVPTGETYPFVFEVIS